MLAQQYMLFQPSPIYHERTILPVSARPTSITVAVKRRESNQAQTGQARTWISSAASRPVARTACVPGELVPSLPCTLQDLSNAQRAWASPVLPTTPLPPVTRLLRARAVSLRGIPDEMTAEGRGGGAGGGQGEASDEMID